MSLHSKQDEAASTNLSVTAWGNNTLTTESDIEWKRRPDQNVTLSPMEHFKHVEVRTQAKMNHFHCWWRQLSDRAVHLSALCLSDFSSFYVAACSDSSPVLATATSALFFYKCFPPHFPQHSRAVTVLLFCRMFTRSWDTLGSADGLIVPQ